VRSKVRRRGQWLGGALGYPLDRLFEEVAYIAYHFHWPHEEIMSLEHVDRQRWVDEIAKINRRLNDALKSEDDNLWR
jgi:hypothetical protein